MTLDLRGQRFSRLVVVELAPSKNGKRTWLCKCDCGNISMVWTQNLRSGNVRSCGCLARETSAKGMRKMNTTHGMCYTPTHRSWRNMLYRCTSPSDPSYARYGAIGITVCARWTEPDGQGFLNFLSDLGERPKGMTLDRIDNAKGYDPTNCRWATPTMQMNNRSTTRFIEFDGRRQSTGQWSAETGIPFGVLTLRIKAGWSPARALTEPVHTRTDMSDKPKVSYADVAWAAAFARVKEGQKLSAAGIVYTAHWKHIDPDWLQLSFRDGKKCERRMVRQGDRLLLELHPE